MIEELRIKCPSCGIILDVRNSKQEAVKRIACPNCKKQLSVDFREELQTAVPQKPLGALYHGEQRLELREGINQIPLSGCEYVEIQVVRLNDGNSKCLVRPLSIHHVVKVNGQPLMANDKVVLAIGDELLTGDTLLVYGKPGHNTIQASPTSFVKPNDSKIPSKPPRPDKDYTKWWVGLAAFIVAVLAIWTFRPTSVKPVPSPVNAMKDSGQIIKDQKDTIAKDNRPKGNVKEIGKEKTPLEDKGQSLSNKSDYDLELLASKGDAEAQLELGNRLIRREGVNNVIRGIKNLRLASLNGSSKAQSVLNKAISALQRRAAEGDSVANSILMSIH